MFNIYRLPENFLTKAYEFALSQSWRTNLTNDQSSNRSELETKYQVGYMCEAIWPGDNQWYAAKIIRVKTWQVRSNYDKSIEKVKNS